MSLFRFVRKGSIICHSRTLFKYYSSLQDSIFNPQKFLQSQKLWKKKDDISGDWELIYRAPLENSIAMISNFITGTTVLLTAGAVYFILDHKDPNSPIVLSGSDVVIANNFNEFIIYIVSFIAIHISLKVLISRYVLRLYKRENTYLAVYQGFIMKRITKHYFKSGEVDKLKTSFFVSWRDSRYSLGNKKAILLQDYFKSPRHLNELLKPKID